jgi:hypothetical protein
MLVRCAATVLVLRNSRSATSRLVCPSATSSATRRSVAVNDPGDAGRPPMRPSTLSVFAIRWRGAEVVEDRTGLMQRFPGGAFLLVPSPHHTEGQQGSGALERPTKRRLLGQRLLQLYPCPGHVATGGQHQPTAARSDDHLQRPVELLPVGPDLLGEGVGLVEVADLDQGVKAAVDQGQQPPFADAVVPQPAQHRVELGMRGGGVSAVSASPAAARWPGRCNHIADASRHRHFRCCCSWPTSRHVSRSSSPRSVIEAGSITRCGDSSTADQWTGRARTFDDMTALGCRYRGNPR